MPTASPARRRAPPRSLDGIGDIPGLRVGHWTDRAAATGCTARCCCPTREQSLRSASGEGRRAPGKRTFCGQVTPWSACMRSSTGGSAFGLTAAGGVVRFLEERGIGFETKAARADCTRGGAVRPRYRRRRRAAGRGGGYAACATACEADVSAGSIGAGTGATVAKVAGIERALKGGLGSASERLRDGTRVGVLAAVNAFGDIHDPDSCRRIAWPRADEHGRRPGAIELLRARVAPGDGLHHMTVVIATTAPLTRPQLLRVAEMGHAGLARAIDPSHTPAHGDTVFAATGSAATPIAPSRRSDRHWRPGREGHRARDRASRAVRGRSRRDPGSIRPGARPRLTAQSSLSTLGTPPTASGAAASAGYRCVTFSPGSADQDEPRDVPETAGRLPIGRAGRRLASACPVSAALHNKSALIRVRFAAQRAAFAALPASR